MYISDIKRPTYLLEEEKLRRNLSLIKNIADETEVEIILAFKAFALWKTFHIFRKYISSTTASSLNEAYLAYKEFGSKAHTYSPAYTEEEIEEITKCSSHLTFNSLSQYNNFVNKVKSIDKNISIGLRINPEYSEVETDLYNPCAIGTRFGILNTKLPITLPEEVEGFHIHCHCESGADVFERTLKHIEAKFSFWFSQIKWINFGGGHLMTKKDYDISLFIKTLKDFKQKYPHLKVILEPGSAFVWQTGNLISRVVDIVEDRGIKTAILNVSFTCHMPDCLEMPYKPTVTNAIIDNSSKKRKISNIETTYRLGGNSCLSGDFIGDYIFNKPLKIGDTVIFEDMIHYTTVKTNMFNGVSHPDIALLHSNGKIEILRTYSYKDYRERMD